MPLFRRKARRLECYYCGQAQSETKGKATTYRFQCGSCGAPNLLSAEGLPMDDPLMHDAGLPANRASYARRAANRPLLSSNDAFDFCQDCRTNQTLTTHLLASYFDDNAGHDIKELEARLPAYKRSLEARYPLVCPDCATAANAIISVSWLPYPLLFADASLTETQL
jgi:hypothetical protein